jgi:hypothetical protein
MEQALAYLNQEEKAVLDTFKKIVVWGFPLHSHTHSYIHACWIRTFEALGKEVHWFHDDDFKDPATFSYEHTLFITEGYADTKIPLNGSSVYFVHNAVYPQKYMRAGARLVEIRFKLNEIHDVNNDFKLDDGTHSLEPLSQDTDYELLRSNSGLHPEFTGPVRTPMNYEAIYLLWATDLFPWEIDLTDAEYIPKERVIHWVGSPTGDSRYGRLRTLTEARGIPWILHNPWVAPVSFEEGRRMIRESAIAPDFRPEGSKEDVAEYGLLNGKNHMGIGYIPCRLFKNISYGHIPVTDSPHAAALFGDAIVFDSDLEKLVEKGLEAQKDIERKRRAMRMVADRHTYIHRARDLLRALLKPRPAPVETLGGTWNQITLVTCLIDIGREKVDGRKFEDYIKWFLVTIQIKAPMVIYVEPSLRTIVEQVRAGLPTKIIEQNVTNFPLAWSVGFVEQILNSEEWKKFARHSHELTNRLPTYAPMIHSKMAYMWSVMDENPFKTDMFFWIDGGLSRFWTQWAHDPRSSEPHIRTVRDLRKSKKIFLQVGGHKEHLLNRALAGQHFTRDEMIGANENILMGGFWGGHRDTVKEVCEYVLRNYVTEMLMKKRIDTEQTTWFFHAQENPQKYMFIPPHKVDVINFLLFSAGFKI